MDWKPTGRIRYRKANWFGRKKMVLQVQEYYEEIVPIVGRVDHFRWRDATPDDNQVIKGRAA